VKATLRVLHFLTVALLATWAAAAPSAAPIATLAGTLASVEQQVNTTQSAAADVKAEIGKLVEERRKLDAQVQTLGKETAAHLRVGDAAYARAQKLAAEAQQGKGPAPAPALLDSARKEYEAAQTASRALKAALVAARAHEQKLIAEAEVASQSEAQAKAAGLELAKLRGPLVSASAGVANVGKAAQQDTRAALEQSGYKRPELRQRKLADADKSNAALTQDLAQAKSELAAAETSLKEAKRASK
jgi:hypothetical protein